MLIKQQISRAEAGVVPCHMPAAQAQGWPCGTGEVIHTFLREDWEPHTASLRGEEIGNRHFDSLTSHSLTQTGICGKKHCVFLGVETPTALSCASRMCFLGA